MMATDIDTQWAYDVIDVLMNAVITAILGLLEDLWNGLGSIVTSLLSVNMGNSYAGAPWAMLCILVIAASTFYIARKQGYV